MTMRTCVVCGKEFAASHGARRLCSPECRLKRARYYIHRFHEKHDECPARAASKQCVICGATFLAGKSETRPLHAKTCSVACNKELHLRHTLRCQAEARALLTRRCIACGGVFHAVDRPGKPTCSDRCALQIRKDAIWRHSQRQKASGTRAAAEARRQATGRPKFYKREWRKRHAEERAQWEMLLVATAFGA